MKCFLKVLYMNHHSLKGWLMLLSLLSKKQKTILFLEPSVNTISVIPIGCR